MPTQAHPQRLGKYEILSVLGRGGMGIVYKARDPVIDRVVAIKTITEATDALAHNQIERLLMEARSAGRLQHPNIVTVFDFVEENGVSYIVQEYAEGSDLGQVIAAKQPLALPAKIDILAQLCTGLGYAHDCGVTHRDMKPQNVRLTPNGVAKILDFGLARYDDTHLTKSGYISGTIAYMSPERLSGEAGMSDDIFALGAVAYEMLTYRRAFIGSEAPQVMLQIMTQTPAAPSTFAELPPQLDAVVLRCLARDARERYATAHDFGAALEETCASAEVQTFMRDPARSGEFREALQAWAMPRRRTRSTRSAEAIAADLPTVAMAPVTAVQSQPAGSPTQVSAVPSGDVTQVVAQPRRKSLAVPLAAAVVLAMIATVGLLRFMPEKPAPAVTKAAAVAPAPPVTTAATVPNDVPDAKELSAPHAKEGQELLREPPKAALQPPPAASSKTILAPPAQPQPQRPQPAPRVAEPQPPQPQPQPQPQPHTQQMQPVPVAAPAPPSRDVRAEIAAFMRRVGIAYQTRDTSFFRENYLRYTDAMGNAVARSPSQRVDFQVDAIDVVDPTHARVTVQRIDDFGKEAPPATQHLLFFVEQQGDAWRISRFERQ